MLLYFCLFIDHVNKYIVLFLELLFIIINNIISIFVTISLTDLLNWSLQSLGRITT